MQVALQIRIKNDPNLYRYLRENSYWYKALNRNPLAIKDMEVEMREKYKLTTVDKIENISKTISFVQTFMDIMK